MSEIIKSGIINDCKVTGSVSLDRSWHVALLTLTDENGAITNYTRTAGSFEDAAAYIHETWSELENTIV